MLTARPQSTYRRRRNARPAADHGLVFRWPREESGSQRQSLGDGALAARSRLPGTRTRLDGSPWYRRDRRLDAEPRLPRLGAPSSSPKAFPERRGHPFPERLRARGVRRRRHPGCSAAAGLPAGFTFEVRSDRAELGEAERFFRRALSLNPGLTEARLRLGRVLLLRGRHKEAADELRQAIRRRTMICSAITVRSSLGLRKRRWGIMSALRMSYARAAELYPTAQSPHLALSALARRRGDRRGRPHGDPARIRLAGSPARDARTRGGRITWRTRGTPIRPLEELRQPFSSQAVIVAADARVLAVAGVRPSSGGRRTPPSRAGSRRYALTCSSPTRGSRCSASRRATSKCSTMASHNGSISSASKKSR